VLDPTKLTISRNWHEGHHCWRVVAQYEDTFGAFNIFDFNPSVVDFVKAEREAMDALIRHRRENL
jgi:hypothetical protein